MSRYDWPRASRSARSRQPARTAWNLGLDAGADLATVTARATGGPTASLAPAGTTDLWQPLGPTTTLDGTTQNTQRNAGRCRDIAVNPVDPRRVYVASALGGLWYSDDFGATWVPVGVYTTLADRADVQPSSTSLSCGAVYVNWGPTEADDEVWLGTGEPHPVHQPYDRGYKGMYSGIGILYAVGPVATVRADRNADPWTRQAQPRTGYDGLRGASVFSFVPDPADPRRIIAATTRGLHMHDPATSGGDPWSLVTVAAWDAAPGSPGSAKIVVTDVAWVPTGRLWTAVRQQGTPLTGVWRGDTGPTGPFVEVPVDARTADGEPDVDRIAIAAAPGHPDVLYVMASGPDSGPALHRIDGPDTVRVVANVPRRPFFGDPRPGDPDQSGYDMAIAVDPGDPTRFMIGGAYEDAPDGWTAAALYRFTVPAATPPAGGTWDTDYKGGHAKADTWVGEGVHADVHRIRWVSAGIDVDVYVCTDGGVYHSSRGGDRGTYLSRTTGMSVTQEVFSVSHPASDGVVLSGVQDNGVQLRIGDGVWRRAVTNGDGGGVAFDPNMPGAFIAQANRSYWTDQNNDLLSPTLRTSENTPFWTEHRASCFYSNPAVIDNVGRTQLAIGTTRVWYSELWAAGRSWGIRSVAVDDLWHTLPSEADPRHNDTPDTTRDVIRPGPLPPGTIDTRATGIRALRWGGPDRLYVLMPGSVHRLDREAGRWRRTRIDKRPTLSVRGTPPPVPSMATGGRHLPPNGSLNDLAVHDPAAARHGSFYVATSHPEEPVWWFDGDGRFHPCGLGATPPPAPPTVPGSPGGTTAPAYAVVVDPDDASIVYVGTAIGVFRGELTFDADGQPSWGWRDMNNGLPEAAAQDLAIASWPLPAPQTGRLKLMRACLQSRGMWEVELSAGPATDVTYLRVHPYDTRRMLPTPMADPLYDPFHADRYWPLDWAYPRNRDHRRPDGSRAAHPDGTAPDAFLWHASPDIRVRPAPHSTPLALPVATPGAPFPWTAAGKATPNVPDRFALWAVQTALHALDERVVPNGIWSRTFSRLLEAIRVGRGLPDVPVVDQALWEHPDVQAEFWADPWARGGPTEADLVERVVGMMTPRPDPAAVSGASVALPAQPSKVEVCVHRRGPTAAAARDVAVLLLRRALTEPEADWSGIPTPAIGGLAALDTLPSGGGELPSDVTIPAGWEVADTTVNVRRPSRDLRTAESAVVSFDVDFTGRTGVWLLLALVRHGALTPELAVPTDLSALVLTSPQLAVRTVHVV